MTNKKIRKLRVAVVCGGPSLERGISLNSARSILDHLESEFIEIVPFYFNPKRKPFVISKSQLYSNTPSDFDFKLSKNSKPLSTKKLVAEIKKCDICFPVIHGLMGEDGYIQNLLTKNEIPFIGPDSYSCKLCFNKFITNNYLKENGFFTIPQMIIKSKDRISINKLKNFIKENKIKKMIVKPATGGSSIGVFSVSNIKEAIFKIQYIFDSKIDKEVLIEPFVKGREFTVIVLENKRGRGVSLIPTEIEISYDNNQIFDYRKKYLPTHNTVYNSPPNFEDKKILEIQEKAEVIFSLFKMKGFARMDGWLLDNGKIWFSDINPVSGMEQNSFFFQQGARIGMSHRDMLRYITSVACKKYGLYFPLEKLFKNKRKPVNVIFGGFNSERQVSLMSGTNVWLKLRKSKIYNPKPFFLDQKMNVWELPYLYILNHTVEEISLLIKNTKVFSRKLEILSKSIRKKLELNKNEFNEHFFFPKKYSLREFISKSPFVFLGLHGSPGEDGKIQKILEDKSVKFNGSNSVVSSLFMDKYRTGLKVNEMQINGIHSSSQILLSLNEMKDVKNVWHKLVNILKSKTIIVKPKTDGCSSGIVRLFSESDLEKYLDLINNHILTIPIGTFKNQNNIIEMPIEKPKELLFENFIVTDIVKIHNTNLSYISKTNWIEITVAVFGKIGKLKIMNPSITIASGEVLSVEEKFQSGTGVNITPPPSYIIKSQILNLIKKRINKLANKMGIDGYARIDAFVNVKNGEVNIIEVNSLPGLTASTVTYHQALAEDKPLYPTEFLEKIIKNKGY